MTRYTRNGLLGLMMAGLSACTGNVGGGQSSTGSGTGTGNSGGPGTGNSGGPGSAGATGTGTGTAGSTGTGTGTGGSIGTGSGGNVGTTGTAGSGLVQIQCSPGIPATTQLRRMMNYQYDAVVRDLLGVTNLGTTADPKLPSNLLYADFDGPMVPDAWRLYQDIGAQIAKQVMGNATQKAKFISCDPATSGCLQTTIQTFGRKAFRRPLTTDEVNRFLALSTGTPTGTAAEYAEATLLAFLVSPSFLMIPETSTTANPGGTGYQLNSYEVAARLSFMLWGSVPDDMLSTAANSGSLTTKDAILTQANRMIMARDKTAPQISAFHRGWVQMNNATAHWWGSAGHDTSKFPQWTTTSITSEATELDNFFAEVAYTNGGYKDLFLSPIGFVNKDNAPVYGMTSTATALSKATLDATQRPGFMTRAGFLSSYSHYTDTAPILRGAFITIFMIGVDPGPPLPGATMIQPPAGTYTTVRQRTDALVNQASSCMGCHTDVINPPGYVMENYDAIGKWQTTDSLGGGAIDATAMVNFGDGNIKQINNSLELMTELSKIAKGQQYYAQNWVAYGYGRAPNPQDQCVADSVSTKIAGTGYSILNLLADLTQADSFRLRVRATP